MINAFEKAPQMIGDSKDDSTTKLEKAKNFKVKGTQLLKEGKYNKAIDNYQKIIDTLKFEDIYGPNKTESKELLQAGRLNISLCLMKLKEWEEAKEMCTKVT